MKKIKILHVINGMGSGGAEMMIMNWYRNIDREKYSFDFLLRSNVNIYEQEIEDYGGRIYYTDKFPRHIWRNYKETKKFFATHYYDVVHIHANALIYLKAAIEAKNNKIPIIIMHSHNTSTAKKIYIPIHKLNMIRINKYANVFLACSKKAGTWMFGQKKYQVIENAIDTRMFNFYPEERIKLRYRYGLANSYVVGHVGRFLPSKNHSFLIDIFVEILKIKENSVLILIGEGEGKKEIENKVKKLGIESKVLFLGLRTDVAKLEQIMDVFIFPSFFEGLPVSLIEAQFTRLPCVVSDNISHEVQMNNAISFLALEKSAKDWAEEAIKISNRCNRGEILFNQNSRNYQIQEIIKKLEDIYLKRYLLEEIL